MLHWLLLREALYTWHWILEVGNSTIYYMCKPNKKAVMKSTIIICCIIYNGLEKQNLNLCKYMRSVRNCNLGETLKICLNCIENNISYVVTLLTDSKVNSAALKAKVWYNGFIFTIKILYWDTHDKYKCVGCFCTSLR